MKSSTSERLTQDPVEREVKLKADLDLALPDLRGVVGGTYRLPEQDLRAAYFDTPDFRLWSRGITLRHRLGEGPASGMWTLKLPEKPTGATLDRTELSWPGSRDEIPAEAQRLLRGLVRSAELCQVAELNTVRRPLELHDKGGQSWAVMDDDTVTVSGGPRDGLRFRQVELELADDRPRRSVSRELDQVVRVLRKAGARHDGSPKLARALGKEAGSTPHAVAQADVGTRSSLEAVIRHSINDGLDRLLDHDYRLRLSAYDPPAYDIHQARVATRRLRSDLRTFRPALDPVWVRHTRDELRWIGSALGNVRDVDVLTSGLSMRRRRVTYGRSRPTRAAQPSLRTTPTSQPAAGQSDRGRRAVPSAAGSAACCRQRSSVPNEAKPRSLEEAEPGRRKLGSNRTSASGARIVAGLTSAGPTSG